METDFQKLIDELRDRISIVDVVGQKVKLARKGREFTGLCPFHNEKTPSFTVNEAKGFYHCFGCGAHGDIIKFEMEANNLPFIDAINKLASKAGLSVPKFSNETSEQIEQKKTLYDIMELACAYFEKNLKLTSGKDALNYLNKRGIDDELIKKFRLGYAPSNNGLRAYLLSKGIAESDMVELGLAVISEKNGKFYDFFRDRVIIPIIDSKNRVIAFGGRILGDGQPKYLNSPETPVFNKRRTLYNLNFARDKAFEARRLIICEGYMDVIAQAKFGFDYSVAPLGTALTEEQIMQAWKVSPMPILCFDGDNAGKRAAMRSVDRVLPHLKAGYSLNYVFLPNNMDPDDFLKEKGADEYEKLLSSTTSLSELLWQKNIEEQPIETPEQKAMFEKKIFEDVAKIADESVRNYYIQDVKNKIYQNIKSPPKKSFYNKQNNQPKKQYNLSVVALDTKLAKFIIAAMFWHPVLIDEYEEKIGMFEIKDAQMQAILDKFVSISHENDGLTSAKLLEILKKDGYDKYIENNLIIKIIKSIPVNELRKDVDDIITQLQLKQLEAEIKECSRCLESSDSFLPDVYEKSNSLKNEQKILFREKNIE